MNFFRLPGKYGDGKCTPKALPGYNLKIHTVGYYGSSGSMKATGESLTRRPNLKGQRILDINPFAAAVDDIISNWNEGSVTFLIESQTSSYLSVPYFLVSKLKHIH